jgi:hypothetical protein
MMNRWCEALQSDMAFRQQLDPVNGNFTIEDAPGYSPAALVMLDYTWRLAGVREEGDSLEWNVQPSHPAAKSAVFRMRTDAGRTAEIKYDRQGAKLSLANKLIARIESGAARLVTDSGGVARELAGISERPQKIAIRLADGQRREVTPQANARVPL